jgi:hypothetical protein
MLFVNGCECEGPTSIMTEFLNSHQDMINSSMFSRIMVKNNYPSVEEENCISCCNDSPFHFYGLGKPC